MKNLKRFFEQFSRVLADAAGAARGILDIERKDENGFTIVGAIDFLLGLK